MPSFLAHFLRGFVMGSADVVPGVSGGTVALVLGIYRRLVASIRSGAGALAGLVRLDFGRFMERFRQVDWPFILPLLTGVLAAVLLLAQVIERLLEEQPVRMAALFFGLVAGSVVVAWRLVSQRDTLRIGLLVISAVAMFFFMALSAGTVADPPLWAFFGAGAIAICAMILPGISGSFLLLMMGMYAPVLGALNDRRFLVIGVFVVGVVVGLALFSTLLNYLLDRHYDTIMASLVGIMLGSLRVLWPWPDGTDGTRLGAPSGDIVIPVLLAVVGAVVVVVITRQEESVTEAADLSADNAP